MDEGRKGFLIQGLRKGTSKFDEVNGEMKDKAKGIISKGSAFILTSMDDEGVHSMVCSSSMTLILLGTEMMRAVEQALKGKFDGS